MYMYSRKQMKKLFENMLRAQPS